MTGNRVTTADSPQLDARLDKLRNSDGETLEPQISDREPVCSAGTGNPPSAQAECVEDLHRAFLSHESCGRTHDGRPFLLKALVEGAQGSVLERSYARLSLALDQLRLGDVRRAFANLNRVRALAVDLHEVNLVWAAAATEARMLMSVNHVQEVLMRGDEALEQTCGSGPVPIQFDTVLLLTTMGHAALALGDTAHAESLVARIGASPMPDGCRWLLESLEAQLDILHGQASSGCRRIEMLLDCDWSTFEVGTGLQEAHVELYLWTGNPLDAVDAAQSYLSKVAGERIVGPYQKLLNLALRACVDLNESAAGGYGSNIAAAAAFRADTIRHLAEALNPIEWMMHSPSVTVDAESADWQAELGRLQRVPESADRWNVSASRWEELNRRHRAAYSRWRQAQELLRRGDELLARKTVIRAWRLASGHKPLTRSVEHLARELRLLLPTGTTDSADNTEGAVRGRSKVDLGLTVREDQVMCLVVRGLTSAQIGLRLGITERTVRKHLGTVYTKAGLPGRAAAAAWWVRGQS